MSHDPKKTTLGWVPAYPEPTTQPFQLQEPEYIPQGYAQQPPYGHVQPAYYEQPHYEQPPHYDQSPQCQGYAQAYPAQQLAPAPSSSGYPGYPAQPYPAHQQVQPETYPKSSQASFAPAAAYNYQHEAAAIVQHMQREETEQQAQQPQPVAKKQRAKSVRPIPGADATRGASNRVRFIRLTYLHLLGAIVTFAALLYLLMTNSFLATKVSAPLVQFALGGRWNWGIVLAAFMACSWIADYWASHATSKATQYLGLGFYVLAEALIFVPLLAIVAWKTQAIIARGGGNPNIIRDSAYVTLGVFTALTASVFITKKDFSFLRSGIVMASGAALTLIILSLSFGFNLGLAFSVGMVLLAASYVLYQTSQVLAHYDPNQHVAASLALFSSVALMFWYVIRIFMRMRE